jgi:hypothetical protein
MIRVYHEHPDRNGMAPRTYGPLNRFDPHVRVGTLAWGDEPRRRTQRWGRRIYEQYEDLDGIRYHAAHQGGESVALWERAPAIAPVRGGDRQLWAVLRYVTVALASQRRYPRPISAAACADCVAAGYSA